MPSDKESSQVADAAPSLVSLLGESLRKPDGSTVPTKDALEGNSVIALYFSAHWCPPCRGFTPVLGKKYTALKEAKKEFEMVFVSSDKDNDAFKEYHKEMPFLALPFELRSQKAALSQMFGVDGIPTLVFFDLKSNEIITKSARGPITSPTFIEDFPYHPKPVNDFGESLEGINSEPSLVVFLQGAPEDKIKHISNSLNKIAVAELSKKVDERNVSRFFTANTQGPVARVRAMCKMETSIKPHEHPLKTSEGNGWNCDGCGGGGQGKRFRCTEGCDFDYCNECNEKAAKKATSVVTVAAPDMVILDLGNGSFVKPEEGKSEVTEANICSFMESFKLGKLAATKL